MKFPQSRTLRNAGDLLALGGGMLALCAFFFLPYCSVETLHGINLNSLHELSVTLTGAQLASKHYPSLADSARLYPREGVISGFATLEPASGEGPSSLWLEPLAAVIAIALAGVLLLFRRKPAMTTGAWLCIWLLIGVAILTLISLLAPYQSELSSFGSLVAYSWGFWMYLLGMFLVALGAGAVRLSWTERASHGQG